MGLLEAYVVYKACNVKVSAKELNVNLILLDFSSFDVILDMDWPETYHTIINYYDKIVTLCPSKKKHT